MNGSVWKWLAAFLAGVVLAGMPAAVVAVSAPSRTDYDRLRAEIVSSQVQAARIEERIVSLTQSNQVAIIQLQAEITELRTALERR